MYGNFVHYQILFLVQCTKPVSRNVLGKRGTVLRNRRRLSYCINGGWAILNHTTISR